MAAPDFSKPANILRALFLVAAIALVVIGGGWALRKDHGVALNASIQNPLRYAVAVNALVPVFAIVHFVTGWHSAAALAYSLLLVASGQLLSPSICYGEANRCDSLPKVETISNGFAVAVAGGWLAVIDPNWVFGPILKLISSVHGFFGLAAAAASVVGAIVLWSTETNASQALVVATTAFLIVYAFLVAASEEDMTDSPLSFVVMPAAVITQFSALLHAVDTDVDDKGKTGGAIIFGGMWIIWLYTAFRLKGPGITEFTIGLFSSLKNLQFLFKLLVLIPSITITVIGAGLIGEQGAVNRPLQWQVTSCVVVVGIIALAVLFAAGSSARKSAIGDSATLLYVFLISLVVDGRRENSADDSEKGYIQILVGMAAAGLGVLNFEKFFKNLGSFATNMPRMLALIAMIINIVGCALWWDANNEASKFATVTQAFVAALILFGAHFGDEDAAPSSYLGTILVGAYVQFSILDAALDERLLTMNVARHRNELVAGESLAFASIWIFLIASIIAHRDTKGGSSAPAGMVASPSTEVVMETVQTAA